MATIGVSKPYYAPYSYDAATNKATYAGGGSLGKATEIDISIETTEDNNLFADNAIAESERVFSSGEMTIGTDDLSQEVSKAILGVVESEVESIEGINETGVKELVFDDRQSAPYLGIGVIIKKVKNGVTKWRAIILTKVKFSIPGDAATTQGESIEWQVPSLTASIMRDDTEFHAWKREATWATESDAERYIKARLNISTAAS